MYPLIKISWH